MKVPLKDAKGERIGEVELRDDLFGIEVNPHAVHMAVRQQLASMREGTASTKTRNEARGGGSKPWRQKGTGRARAGSIRSPIWRGGGTVFGPKPRDYSFRVPRKVRRLAFMSALSNKASEDRIVVLRDFILERPSTKAGKEVIDALKLAGTSMVVLSVDDENVEKSIRNLPEVEVFLPEELNTYDIMRLDNLVFFEGALKRFQGGEDEESP